MDLTNFNPLTIILLLIVVGLAPYAAVMVTSFTKLVVVMSLIRNALGVQSVPPNMVINGLALILTIFVMNPVLQESFRLFEGKDLAAMSSDDQKGLIKQVAEPFRSFLMKHSGKKERAFFVQAAQKLWPPEHAADVKEDNLLVLVPAFTVGELTSAFQIGFLLYLPFVAIDLIISNILLAMGMMMVSPTTISLPFKLLLFVLVDGWGRLVHGLVLTYA
jgi:type III secretion protein R